MVRYMYNLQTESAVTPKVFCLVPDDHYGQCGGALRRRNQQHMLGIRSKLQYLNNEYIYLKSEECVI